MGKHRQSVFQLTIVLATICCTKVIISSPVPAPDEQPELPTATATEAEMASSSEASSTRTGLSSNGNGRVRTGLWYRGQTQQNPVDLYSQSQGQGQILSSRGFPYNLTGVESLGVGSNSKSHHHHHQQQQHGIMGSSSSSLNSAYQDRLSASDEHVAAWREVRKRDKDRRLIAIKEYVMQQLGFTTRNPSRPVPTVDKTFIQQFNPSSPFSGQLQTLYASCDIPSNVDEDTWNSPDNFNLYFNIPSSMLGPVEETISTAAGASPQNTVDDDDSSSESLRSFHAMIRASSNRNFQRPNLPDMSTDNIGSSMGQLQQQQQQQRQQLLASPSKKSVITSNVISAKLKLYKIGRGEGAEIPKFEQAKPSEPCNHTTVDLSPGSTDQISGVPSVRNLSVKPSPTGEQKIRVSVYWYTVPVKKHHYKKKLLDTKMVSVKESKWVEFDIRNAGIMGAWLEQRENYGLVVQVENEDNDWMDARYFFAGVPCAAAKGTQSTDNSNSTAQNTNETSASGGQPEPVESSPDIFPPPVLEICTLSIPSAPVVTSTLPVLSKQTQNRIIVTDPKVKSAHHHQHQNQRRGHKHRHSHGENRRHHNGNNRNNSNSNSNRRDPQEIETPTWSLVPNQSSMTNNDSSSVTATATATVIQQNQPSTIENRSQNRSSNNSTDLNNGNGDETFSLDEDHPLRDILATVASSHGSSNESRQRKGQSSLSRQGHGQQAPVVPTSTPVEQQRVDLDYYNDEDYDDDNTADVEFGTGSGTGTGFTAGNTGLNNGGITNTARVNGNVNNKGPSTPVTVDDDEVDDDDVDDGGHDVIIQKIYISPPATRHHESSASSRSRRHHRPSKTQSQLQTDFEQVGII